MKASQFGGTVELEAQKEIQAVLDKGEPISEEQTKALHEDADPDIDEEKFQNWVESRNR